MNDQPASHQTNDIAAVDAKEQLMSTEPPNREIHTGPGDSRDRGGGASLHPFVARTTPSSVAAFPRNPSCAVWHASVASR